MRGRWGRRTATLAFAIVSVALPAVSWACVPQAKLVTLQPRSFGPGGSEVTVNGLGFDDGRVEVRWGGPEGALLGTAEGPNFSVPVTVPDEAEGLYSVVVLNRGRGGGVGSAASAPFQLVANDRPADPVERPGSALPAPPSGDDATDEAATGDDPTRSWRPPRSLFVVGGAGLFALGVCVGSANGRRRSDVLAGR